jgi:hypothetical protein
MRYLEHEGYSVSRAEFEMNLFEKLNDRRFVDDGSFVDYRNKLGLSVGSAVCVTVAGPTVTGG